MNLYLVESADKHCLYTYRTLYSLMERNGHTVCKDPAGADVILVSLDDQKDITLVRLTNPYITDR